MSEKVSPISEIVIFGAGYVGMSLAVLLAQYFKVQIIDVDNAKVKKINKNQCPIKDDLMQQYLNSHDLNLSASIPSAAIYRDADLFIIATPTNYDPATNSFDTSSITAVASSVIQNNTNPNALIVIKSTVPVGYTAALNQQFNSDRVVFSPEFLREGSALLDNLHPSRIIVGGKHKHLTIVSDMLRDAADGLDAPIQIMDSDSAEAVKLFSNTFLAMRVSFFNELDSFAIEKNLDARNIINGVCHDPRIGDFYNNPSFGYGGYCLPKDTKQLLATYNQIPQNLMQAIVDANQTRQNFIASQILKKKPSVVGIYKLAMKEGSDNFRSSSILGVIEALKEAKQDLIIFEPGLATESFQGIEVYTDLGQFKIDASIILTNRACKELSDSASKIYTRDLFHTN
jgi:UDPglucose 6-dehydrogenase